jgi:hypothetical protein
MRLETILLSLLIVMSVVVITEQQAKAQVTNDSSNLHQKLNHTRDVLGKFEKCNSAENETLYKMNVMGLDDKAAIFALGLNKSKVNK